MVDLVGSRVRDNRPKNRLSLAIILPYFLVTLTSLISGIISPQFLSEVLLLDMETGDIVQDERKL